MFIEPHYIALFKEFCGQSSGTKFEYPLGSRQPDVRFIWLDNVYWGYYKANGIDLHGEEIDILKNTWFNALKALDGERRENDSAGQDL